jgi:hypothetical protein
MNRVEDGTTDGAATDGDDPQRRRARSSVALHPEVNRRLERLMSGRGGRLTYANIVQDGLETQFQKQDGDYLTLLYALMEAKAAAADEATRSEIKRGVAELREAVASYGRALGKRARSVNFTTRTDPAHLSAIEQALNRLASFADR